MLLGMPVAVLLKNALGGKDKEGAPYLGYFLQPRLSGAKSL